MARKLLPQLLAPALTLLLSAGLVATAIAANDAEPKANPQLALHVLNRLGYGPRPGDLEEIEKIGVDRYIAQQLDPASIPESPEVQQQLASLNTLQMSPEDLFLNYGPETVRAAGDDEAMKKAAKENAKLPLQQASAARLMRALQSPRQLNEVMVDFWFNHFNVFSGKGLDHLWIGNYEETTIRPYALGHFRDLLGATAKHPAMLFYLDNVQSSVANAPAPSGFFGLFSKQKKKQASGLNENYAREVMELHTLGVDGGYTQKDVTELARILTGWTFQNRSNRRGEGGVFHFDPNRHDFGDKVFLGQTFHGDGVSEGERALDMLAESPVTAHHLSQELAQYFVADNPPPALVDHLAKVYLDSHGDIRTVLTALFASPEFRSPKNDDAKFKTPYQYLVSALRATGFDVINFKPLTGALAQLGMPLYGCPTPDGYKNTKEAWLNPDAMVRRINFAVGLVRGAPKFRQAESADPQDNPHLPPADGGLVLATLGNAFSAKTLAAYDDAPPNLRAALLLGSPEFMLH